ncbi:MAG: glycosyltransferase family 2 protein [Paracoccaceae bacterium]
MADARAAITVTMADCKTWLHDWIAHHMHVADHLFIWLDDPGEMAFAEKTTSDRVSILPGQQIDRDSRLTQTLARQDANTNSAIQMAAMAGFDWLLHVDADELFVPLSNDLWDSSAEQLIFPNHEAAPVWYADEPFVDVTRFRVNGRHRFLLYDNGKAALRLGAPPVTARAHGPHRFAGAEGVPSDKAVILHYAAPGFEHWWRKYERLGAFSDLWDERADAPIPTSFHTRSRDAVLKAIRTDDRSVAEEFYRKHMGSEGREDLLEVRRNADGRVILI